MQLIEALSDTVSILSNNFRSIIVTSMVLSVIFLMFTIETFGFPLYFLITVYNIMCIVYLIIHIDDNETSSH